MPQKWGCPLILPDPPPRPHLALPPGVPCPSLWEQWGWKMLESAGRAGPCSGSCPGATTSHQVPALGKGQGLLPTSLSQGLAFRFQKSQGRVTTDLPQIPAKPPVPPLMENLLPLGTSHLQTPSGATLGAGLSSLAVQPHAS